MPITPMMLRKYKRGDVFVETGTESGHGVICALAAGFRLCMSCDIDQASQSNLTHHAFYGIQEVQLFTMNSVDFLTDVRERRKSITEGPILYWLDAHSATETPILMELSIIKSMVQPGDVILIDDMRIFRAHNEWARFVHEEHVVESLRGIMPATRYDSDSWDPKDVLVGTNMV